MMGTGQDLVARAARQFGALPAIEEEGAVWTFLDLEASVSALQARLPAGIPKSVWLTAPTGREAVARLLALLRTGARIVLESGRESPDNARAFRAELSAHLAGKALFGEPEGWDERTSRMDEGRLVFPTSGSTGRPKPVVHSVATLSASARGATDFLSFGPGDRWPVTLSTHHVGGMGVLFRTLVSGGCSVWPREARRLVKLVRECSHISLVPTQLARLLDDWSGPPPAGLKRVLIGGASLSDSLARRASAAGWPIVLSYGLTEMGSLVTATQVGETGSSGRVLPGRRLRIAAGGEVEVGGEALFLGYGDDAVGAWFQTGDLGFLDQQSRLHITGRRDSMFTVGGENLHPERVERELGAVDGATAIIVVPVPDAEYGHRPVAFFDGDCLEDDLATRAQDLPGLFRPTAYFRLQDVVPTGIKHSRTELAAIAGERLGIARERAD